jgi:hypothetical protein
LFGGGINPNAQTFAPSSTTQTVIAPNSSWKYRDTGVDLGSSWRASSFDDSGWAFGNAELGYGDGDEATVVSFGPNANNKHITTYFRKNFSVSDVSNVTALTLRLKRDDGAVVYINGMEAIRSNMPTGTITASTLAASAVGGAEESTFYEFSLNPGLLINGNNTIAVEIHQANATSSDLSFDAQLEVTQQSAASIPMGLIPQFYRARTLTANGIWSALEQASFSVPLVAASASNLAVTEIHYNPAVYNGPNASSAPFNLKDNFEFIELRNKSVDVISLDGVSLLDGVTYTFPSSPSGPVTWLLPGESIVVVKNQQAFAARYLTVGSSFLGIKIAPGDYGTTNLNNGGESIGLYAANSQIIQSFSYDDELGWPVTPDGGGPSLTVIRTSTTLYNNASNWRASFVQHGTPGREENDAPIDLSLSASSVVENSAGALIGLLSTVDPDDLDQFTYSIVSGLEGAQFAIVGPELRVGAVGLNFESGSSRGVVVRTTDFAGASFVKTLTITVIDANDPPIPNMGGPYNPSEGVPISLQGTVVDEDVSQSWIFEWDIDYDGSIFTTDATGPSPTVTFPNDGSRTIALRVVDNGSPAQTATVTGSVVISNLPPQLSVNSAALTGTVLSTLPNSGTWSDVPADVVSLSASHGLITKIANGSWSWTYTPPDVVTSQVVTITGSDGVGSSSVTFTVAASAATPSLTITSGNRTYDGSAYTAVASMSGSVAPTPTITYQYYSDATASTVISAPSKAGTYYVRAFSAANSNNTATQSAVTPFTIERASLVASFSANNKPFDNTTAATIASRSLGGVIGTDVVTISGGTATFADVGVGNNKTVTAMGLTIGGADAGNYTVNDSATALANITATVFNRQVFYNNSGFETAAGNNTPNGVAAALSSSKILLQSTTSPQTTTFASVSNFSRGLNGAVLDIAGLTASSLVAGDFTFRIAPSGASGVQNPSATWTSPSFIIPTIAVTAGSATIPGRVRLEWPDNAIQNTWLQIIVKANANTGLPVPQTFYIGHAMAEVNGAAAYRVTGADLSLVQAGISNSIVSVNDIRDVNKDRRITGADLSFVQARISNSVLLNNITIPAAGSNNEGSAGSGGGGGNGGGSVPGPAPVVGAPLVSPISVLVERSLGSVVEDASKVGLTGASTSALTQEIVPVGRSFDASTALVRAVDSEIQSDSKKVDEIFDDLFAGFAIDELGKLFR